VLLDVMMPKIDGIRACELLRADGRISHVPVIMMTAQGRPDEKVRGLDAGADDYVVKPFDPSELVARIRTTLRRALEMRSASPLTGLPGNPRIELELARRLELEQPFALLYADLNEFKAYNDHYGFLRGDDAIRELAACMRRTVAAHGDSETFLGHVGGDDFVLIARREIAETLAADVCRGFDERVSDLYVPEDRARGSIEVMDRQGTPRTYALVSVSIGIARANPPRYDHASEIVDVATEMKGHAKRSRTAGSNHLVDHRGEGAT